MEGHLVFSGWDTILLAVPFAALLMMVMFGIDTHITSRPREYGEKRRAFCHPDAQGEIVLCDPDGRTWNESTQKTTKNVSSNLKSRRWYVLDEEASPEKTGTIA